MGRSPAQPTDFRCVIGGVEAFIHAIPPDETDPSTDFLWTATLVDDPGQVAPGHGFTSHQAVHDLIEHAESMGIRMERVNQIWE